MSGVLFFLNVLFSSCVVGRIPCSFETVCKSGHLTSFVLALEMNFHHFLWEFCLFPKLMKSQGEPKDSISVLNIDMKMLRISKVYLPLLLSLQRVKCEMGFECC